MDKNGKNDNYIKYKNKWDYKKKNILQWYDTLFFWSRTISLFTLIYIFSPIVI